MTEDDVMQQVWAAKEAFARRFNHDIQVMGRHLQSLDEQDDSPLIVRASGGPVSTGPPQVESGGMPEDNILREILQFRDEYARRFNYDVEAMMADLRASQEASDWPVVESVAEYLAAKGEPAPETVEVTKP